MYTSFSNNVYIKSKSELTRITKNKGVFEWKKYH